MLTKESKMWEILVEAKKILSFTITLMGRGEGEKLAYVCHAVVEVAEESQITYTSVNYVNLRNIIYQRLGNQYVLTDWLQEKGYVKSIEECYENQGRRLQATRHAWVDSMIEEFKAKGI